MPNPSFAKTRIGTSLILTAVLAFCPDSSASAQTAYDFGNPSADEQYSLELINRARANPPAEGTRLANTTDPYVLNAYSSLKVDLAMMQNEFNAIAPAPPLAPNAKLTTTARNHSNWMLTNNVQQHDEGSLTPWQRMTNAGYSYSTAGENIYASSKSVWYAHAGFQVDWGTGTGGMQSPRGHRDQIHSPSFREVGVGIVYGNKSNVGPLLVTQDFGTQQGTPTFGTGVAYYDLNSNNFYDPGEGISGLRADVSGASYYCTTAAGGGWTVPIPATAATRTVSFTGLNVNQNVSMPVTASTNAKADLKLTYSPPAITSSATAYNGYAHTVQFNAIGGATSYKWNRWNSAAAAAENCDSETNITKSITGSYTFRSTNVRYEGVSSFHLALATEDHQWFELNTLFHGNPSASLTYRSRIRASTASERFKVQVKEEGGLWTDIDVQSGIGGADEPSFSLRTATLPSMAGKTFRVRFLHQYGGGTRYVVSDSVGWYVDAINFTNVSTLTNNVQTTLATNSGSFAPSATGTYQMSVVPVISGKDFPAGYQTLTVTSGSPPVTAPSITSHPASVTINSGGTTTLSVTASGSGLSYQWYQGASGTTTTPVGTNSASFTTPALTSTTSYWVKVSNSGGSANSNTATVTVNPPTVAVSATPAVVTEDGATSLLYTFTRTGPTTNAMTVNFSVAGTATPTADYTQTGSSSFSPTSGTIRIPASASSATITVAPAPDPTVEPDETVVLAVSSGSGYTAAPAAAAGTIANDDIQPPSITDHPASITIISGGTTTLSVTATGSGLSYQWYLGTSGTTTTPVGTNSPSFTTPALTGNTSYWVRVTNTGGSTNSTTSTITVIPPPVITCQPVSTTVKKNSETVTLTVFATGPGLTYQWYQGASGTTNSPIAGATGSSYTTPTLTSDATYWVRVSNASNSAAFADSITSTVKVTPKDVTRTFATWAGELETANSLAAGTLSNNPNGDHDKDGRSNLIECAFGANPIVANDPAPGMPKVVSNPTQLVVEYTKDTSLSGITVVPVISTNLAFWKAPGDAGTPSGFTDALVSSTGTRETRQAKIPRASGPRHLIRMRVENQ